jgi:hypothetical protein
VGLEGRQKKGPDYGGAVGAPSLQQTRDGSISTPCDQGSFAKGHHLVYQEGAVATAL